MKQYIEPKRTKQPIVFLKLDFAKAYDKVSCVFNFHASRHASNIFEMVHLHYESIDFIVMKSISCPYTIH